MEFSIFEDSIKNAIGTVIKSFTDEVKHIVSNRMLEYQAEEFRRNLYTKTLLHRAEPKNLFEFYVPLHIRSVDFRKQDKLIPTTSISEIFKIAKRITLIGSAGSGKSTIVRYLFLNCVKENYKIPLKVELRYLNDFEGTLLSYIKDQIFKMDKIAETDSIIERMLLSGKFVVFLDGYDEINSTVKESVTKEIDDLVRVYAKNHYILTSRPYTNVDLLPSFHNFFVSDLSKNEIEEFVRKQLPNDEKELAEKIIEAVHKEDNKAFATFLTNPLLLSMFILSFQSYANIPQKRNIFYKQVFDALFSMHDSMSKLAFVREKQSGLSKESFEDVLRLFSFISFFEEKFVFTTTYLEEKLIQIKERKKNIEFDNEKLIQDLQVAIGILNKEGLEFTFPHRSLQEFFAAEYIANLNPNNKQVIFEKLYSRIKDNSHILLENGNFYSLLKELDNTNFTKLIALPMLKSIDDKIKLTSSSDSFNVWGNFNEILLFYRAVLQDLSKFKEFIVELDRIPFFFLRISKEEIDRNKYIFAHIEKHFFPDIKDGDGSKLNEIICSKCEQFIRIIPKIYSELEAKLIEEEESDAKIINLI